MFPYMPAAFLGLTNFFRKFILGYLNLAAPVTGPQLTKNKVFVPGSGLLNVTRPSRS